MVFAASSVLKVLLLLKAFVGKTFAIYRTCRCDTEVLIIVELWM